MTNKENGEIADRSSHIPATTIAVHLVSQVLDEACIILNASKEFGQPWLCESKLNKVNKDMFVESNKENSTFSIEMGDGNEVNIRHGSNAMATSTPQKFTDELKRIIKSDTCIIGQGDEEFNSEEDTLYEHNDLSKSPSTFINRLFDMSDVEYIADDAEVTQKTIESSYSQIEGIIKIVESCVESALKVTFLQDMSKNDKLNETIERSQSSKHSSYSLLDDAFGNNFTINTTFFVSDGASCSKIETNDCTYDSLENNETSMNVNETVKRNDVAFYENAYVTLNRDYEEYSEEEELVHQDSKSLTLQEVELSAKNASSVKLPTCDKVEYKDLATTSAVSASAISRKSGLVRRCRLQGARLLSCLRGWWWRRKLPGRRKEPRVPGAVRGQYPLSPSARLRATSLIDHRVIRSSSPSLPIVWKFNTINESMINSAQWNEYAFQTKPDCEEY